MKKALIVSAGLLLPIFASAQLSNIETNIVTPIGRIINLLIPIVFALAMLYFFYGLAQYILNSGNDDARQEGKNKMIWGIVALFVMAAVWGIVRFLGTAIGITPGQGAGFSPSQLVPQ